MRGSHLSQNLVQPLQWSMKVNLNPTGGACDILAMILSSPTLKSKNRGRVIVSASKVSRQSTGFLAELTHQAGPDNRERERTLHHPVRIDHCIHQIPEESESAHFLWIHMTLCQPRGLGFQPQNLRNAGKSSPLPKGKKCHLTFLHPVRSAQNG